MTDYRDALNRLTRYWNHFTPESVLRISEFYTEDANFRDPFNDVSGTKAIAHLFNDMYVRLDEPHFTVTETLLEDNRALLIWDFSFRIKALKPELVRHIHGTSVIRFSSDGRVTSHHDYWDAAGQLYAKLPIIGPVIRWLNKRNAA
jgi:steroid Delta-isomerase